MESMTIQDKAQSPVSTTLVISIAGNNDTGDNLSLLKTTLSNNFSPVSMTQFIAGVNNTGDKVVNISTNSQAQTFRQAISLLKT
jgi:hypothetical protein